MQRKLHPLEGIVAGFALVIALMLTIGFAQAEEVRKQKAVFLRSSSALVLDAATGEVVINKNSDAVVPIASITKLMTAMVILDRGLDLRTKIVLSRDDLRAIRGSRTRLRSGASLTRGELLLLSLMASENLAAAALGRTYPGGMDAFVEAMNAKAKVLGMSESVFVEPTGLSPQNVSNALDLAVLVRAANEYPLIREYSTQERATVFIYKRPVAFGNTNRLVRSSHWDIDLSKTGYISQAGRCLVMRVHVAEKDLIVVLLDSWGRQSRIGDANRIRKWVESNLPVGQSS
ncbi:MAG TPA: D-alanyl-D-alanine endopeptidase [Burkholderiales bacterium]|nr:D-alanyl-D-alanine endopeptidase [Burkholderiales bacterium]